MAAATDTGFFYVRNHGIEERIINDAFAASRRLFALPVEIKNSLPKADWHSGQKIYGMESNKVADGTVRESFSQVFEVHKEMQAAWPTEADCPDYRHAVLRFMHAMHPVASQILSCFASGLGLPSDHFDKAIDISSTENCTTAQFNFYPSAQGQSWRETTPRIFPHTDESLITLLHTSPGSVGLELAAGKDGKAVDSEQAGYYKIENWVPCPHKPGHIVVNVGDPLQLWSEGVLKSNYHRVRLPRPNEPQGDRYSMGYFVWPSLHEKIQGQSQKFPATTMAEYMSQKGKLFNSAYEKGDVAYEELGQLSFAVGLPQLQAAAA